MKNNLILAHQQYIAEASPETLNALALAVRDYVITLCRKRNLSQSDVDDIAQETVVTVWSKLGKYDPTRSSFRTWIHRLTLDQIAHHYRTLPTEEHDDAIPTDPGQHHHPAVASTIQIVRKASSGNRELIDMVLIHGSIPEAARQLGITERAARNRLRRIGEKINMDAA